MLGEPGGSWKGDLKTPECPVRGPELTEPPTLAPGSGPWTVGCPITMWGRQRAENLALRPDPDTYQVWLRANYLILLPALGSLTEMMHSPRMLCSTPGT